MQYRLGFDIGGTFTDLYLFNQETGELIQEKVSTTPDDFSRGAMNGIERILKHCDTADIARVSHGTTVATNALIEREGVDVGLVTTEGFRDVLAIGRENREKFYNISPEKIPAFAERRHRFGVQERIDSNGEIQEPLDESEVAEAADFFATEGIESLAVSLIHAYNNDVHERRIKEIIETQTDIDVSLSSEVRAEVPEYERTLSTVINAYLSPLVEGYIETMEEGLSELGLDQTLHLMQANGGVMTPENLDGRSIQLINSGPAAGVLGAQRSAEAADVENIITLDMGGTSSDACIVRDGEIETTTKGEINQIPLLFPQVDVRTIGAGGGSIAWVDRANMLKVGPKSAGADPGPACYGRGGTEPTVTDAALVLGYFNPDNFLGGEMEIDEDAAWDALHSLASKLGEEDPLDLADGILDIATTKMRRAIRLVTVEKGYDPRNFCLTCYGGAGPLFVSRLARELRLDRAMIPISPGVLSAFGLSMAGNRHDFSQSKQGLLDQFEPEHIATIYSELRQEAREVVDNDLSDTTRSADMRYQGQRSTVSIEVPTSDIDSDTIAEIREQFDQKYEEIYGYSMPEESVEALTWRLQTTQSEDDLEITSINRKGSVEDAKKGTREVYEDGTHRTYTIYDRSTLPADVTFEGPAVIEETESTVVADSDTEIRVDGVGNILLDL